MLLKRLITNRNVHLGALLFGASRYMYRGHFFPPILRIFEEEDKKTRKENESFFNSIYIYIFKMEKDLDHFAYIHVYIIDRSNEIDEKKDDYFYLFFSLSRIIRDKMRDESLVSFILLSIVPHHDLRIHSRYDPLESYESLSKRKEKKKKKKKRKEEEKRQKNYRYIEICMYNPVCP